jgi:hypothetical protein
MMFKDRLILRGIHPEYNCLCRTYKAGGLYLAECREFHYKSRSKKVAITGVLNKMVKFFEDGGKLEGFRYGDFKYIALYKNNLPASVDIFNKDYPINEWHGSGFEAREVDAKTYLAILKGSCEIWDAGAVKHGSSDEDYHSRVDDAIYPVRSGKRKTGSIWV